MFIEKAEGAAIDLIGHHGFEDEVAIFAELEYFLVSQSRWAVEGGIGHRTDPFYFSRMNSQPRP